MVSYLSWVDYEFGHSTISPVLLGQTEILQNQLVCWARWWKTQIIVNPIQVTDYHPHPVLNIEVDISSNGDVMRIYHEGEIREYDEASILRADFG